MRTKGMSEFNIQKLAPSRWLAKAGLLSSFSLRITLKKKSQRIAGLLNNTMGG